MTTSKNGLCHAAGNTFYGLGDGRAVAGLSVVVSAAAILASTPAMAVESTWLASPSTNEYFTFFNWDTADVPASAGDTAIFGQSDTTVLTISAPVTVDAWVFSADADNYSFSSDQVVTFLGDGIVINGGDQLITNNVGGEIRFFNDSSAGSTTIANNATIVFWNESSAGDSGLFTGATGAVTFGNHSTAGTATINTALGGALRFFEYSSAADSEMSVNGSLTFGHFATADNAFIINNAETYFFGDSDAGNAIILNDGVLEFSEFSNAANATITTFGGADHTFAGDARAGSATIGNSGRLRFLDDSTAGTATITNNVLTAETVFFGNSSAADATIDNNGLLAFADNSTAGDATITNSGELLLLHNSSAGNATITNDGFIQLALAASLGHARLINSATATVDISALLGAFGTTVGSIEGAGDIILGDRELNTGLNDLSTEFGGDISGTGTLVKQGAGVFTLSGMNTYTGSTFVNGGALIVNGSVAASADVNINAGGTLGGEGTVSNVLVTGGTVAPGNSIGMLNVAGNITFNAGSIYEVELNSAGQSDLIHATGTVTLNGGTVEVVLFPDFALDTQYIILTAAGGGSGAFDGVDFASASLFLNPALSYGSNDVALSITQTADFDSVALTPNQIAAAGGTQSLGGGELFNAIALLGTEDEARAAFDAISGGIHASAKTALIEDSRFVREAANARLRAAGEGLGFWTQAFGASGHTDGDGNAAALDRSTGGLFIGADGEVFDGWHAGVLAGYSRSSFDAGERASSGSADSFHLSAYGGTEWNGLAARFGGAYSWHDLEVNRTAAFTGFSDSLSSSYSAGTGQIFGELGYGMKFGIAEIEPFANLAYVNLSTDGFTENGGAAALTSPGGNTDATFATIGLRAEAAVALGGMNGKAKGMVGYRHAVADVPTSSHSFVAGGNAFTVAGVPIGSDTLVLDAGLGLSLAPKVTLGLAYSGQFGSGSRDHAAKANLSIKF